MISFTDTSELNASKKSLEQSIQDKEVLLREIHHRVKNNLQIVSSLLNLQRNRVDDPATAQILQDSQNRIASMALIHDTLFRSPDLSTIDFASYLRALVAGLLRSLCDNPAAISLRADLAPDIFLHPDKAILCGLIVNELITNALKHGLSEGQPGELFVTLAMESGDESNPIVCVTVGNTGQTLPPDFDLRTSPSMGLRLVNSLIRQLAGTISLETGQQTTFKVCFPL
jgi:two-component system CheB/CheR fusion protein